jgi:hypothetical protein
VFIRVFSSSELRLGFAIATVARWKLQRNACVHVIAWNNGLVWSLWPSGTHIIANEPVPFATSSLRIAEQVAISDPYIICNDDNLPYGQDFVSKGLDIMARYPEYGVISGVVTNGHEPYDTENEVHKIHAVGGLVFLRKGLVTEFPPLEDCHWDIERHRQVTAKGYKSGYSYRLPYLHMGAHFSVANPAFFTGA